MKAFVGLAFVLLVELKIPSYGELASNTFSVLSCSSDLSIYRWKTEVFQNCTITTFKYRPGLMKIYKIWSF